MAAYSISVGCRNHLFAFRRILKPYVLNYSTKKSGKVAGKAGQVMEKKVLPVETDPSKLVNYVCGSNIYKEGEDIKLKDDSEYPDWLWTLRLERTPIPLEELDPNTIEYWRRLNKLNTKRNAEFLKVKKPK